MAMGTLCQQALQHLSALQILFAAQATLISLLLTNDWITQDTIVSCPISIAQTR